MDGRGRFTDENREGALKPEVDVPHDVSAQETLLAHAGRHPG